MSRNNKNKKNAGPRPSREEIDNFCCGDNDAVIAYLTKYGTAFINEQDADGRTALMNAAAAGDEYMMTTLLNKGANVNLKDEDGRTALMEAATVGYAVPVELLLKNGARVNEQDDQGTTALMEAVVSAAGDTDTVSLLLGWGADTSLQDKDDTTALKLAEDFGYSDTAALLQRWVETQKKEKEQKALEKQKAAENKALKAQNAATEEHLKKLHSLLPSKPSRFKKKP